MKTIVLIFLLAVGLASAGYIGWSPSYSYSHHSPVIVRRVYSSPRYSSGWNSGYGYSGWNSGWNGGYNSGYNSGWRSGGGGWW